MDAYFGNSIISECSTRYSCECDTVTSRLNASKSSLVPYKFIIESSLNYWKEEERTNFFSNYSFHTFGRRKATKDIEIVRKVKIHLCFYIGTLVRAI